MNTISYKTFPVLSLSILFLTAFISLFMFLLKPYYVQASLNKVRYDFLAIGKAMNAMYCDGGEPESIYVGEKWSTFENIIKRTYPTKYMPMGEYKPPLTTPIAYLEKLPRDPFHPYMRFYGYCSLRGKYLIANPPIILHSFGPDLDLDINLQDLERSIVEVLSAKPHEPPTEANPYSAAMYREVKILNLIIHKVYDPTNGLKSDGDIVQVATVSDISTWKDSAQTVPVYERIVQLYRRPNF